jgi:protein phosphatase
MEDAQLVHPFDQAAASLFARDANFLARTLGVLAGVVEEAPKRADPTIAALGAIVAHGAANEYRSPEEVGTACAAALPRTELSLPEAPAAAGRLAFVAASATSVGRVRSENQDAAAVAVFDVTDDVSSGHVGPLPAALLLVADGMGGEERGELASRIAARVVSSEFIQGLLRPSTQTAVDAALFGQSSADAVLPSVMEVLSHAANNANDLVRRLALNLGKATGTTLTAIGITGGRAALAHVGDSRAYLLRAGELTQLSEDHTLLARLQSMNHPLLQDPAFAVPRNYLYRSLGQEEDSEPDMVEFSVSPGDRILLCSDGLWDEVDPETLHSLLSSGETPPQCAQALVAAADAVGGHDNSTAVVAFVQLPG